MTWNEYEREVDPFQRGDVVQIYEFFDAPLRPYNGALAIIVGDAPDYGYELAVTRPQGLPERLVVSVDDIGSLSPIGVATLIPNTEDAP